MNGVYAYLASDGTTHWWDVANRGGRPLCGKDVSFLQNQQSNVEPPGCDGCVDVMRTVLEWEDYQERG